MDKKLIKEITESSFFDSNDILKLFNSVTNADKTVLANGTVLCGDSDNRKSLIVFRFKPCGVMAEPNNRAVILSESEKEKEMLTDSILYKDSKPYAVLRKRDDKFIINTADKEELNPGEILEPERKFIINNDRIYLSDVSAIMLYLALKCAENGKVSVALVNESLAGEGALSEAVRVVNPGRAIAVAAAAETEGFKVGGGTGIVIKDGCCVVSKRVTECMENSAEGSTQFYIGKTDTGLERLSISAALNGFCGLYIAATGIETKICELSAEDVEKTQNFLLKISDTFDII